MKIEKIGVIGAGIMGSGITQVVAQSGIDVIMVDVDDHALNRGINSIYKSLSTFEQKEIFNRERVGEIKAQIKISKDIRDLADVDFVIEAVPENMELKKSVFQELDTICHEKTILATNTSSLSITEIASATSRRDKVVGMHFSNPVPLMTGIEIIKGVETSQDVLEAIYLLAKRLGKVCCTAKDFPGFAGNRLLMPLINEGFHILFQGISKAEDIDLMCKQSFRHPMGPLELADLIGLDTVLFILEYLHREIGERYRPCPLLKQLVLAGHIGRKTGKGVYDYSGREKKSRSF